MTRERHSRTTSLTDKRSAVKDRWRFLWSAAVLKLDVSVATKVVYQSLLNRCNGHRLCFPSFATLAKDCGLRGKPESARRTVMRAVDTLRRLELLVVERATVDTPGFDTWRHDQLPNIFTLRDPNGVTAATPRKHANEVTPVSPRRRPNGVTPVSPRRRERGDTCVQNGVTPVSPKQLKEQPIKSKSSGLTADKPPRAPETSQHKAMFGAIAEAFGYPLDAMDGAERKRIGKAATSLIDKKAGPEDVAVRKRRYGQQNPDWGPCTIEALVKWWHDHRTDKTAKSGSRVEAASKYGDANDASTKIAHPRLSATA